MKIDESTKLFAGISAALGFTAKDAHRAFGQVRRVVQAGGRPSANPVPMPAKGTQA